MTIQTITLNQLLPPHANPRRRIESAALEGLAQSIKSDGLLQNLVVRKKGRKFEIVSGERRFRALSLLAERGDIGTDFPVPVEVRAKLGSGDALRLATVENIQREQLDPIDEAEAFARMVGEGAELADVAAKAGVSEATVKRRLALAALCDEAKEAVRSGTVSLSAAEAMTLGTADQQREVLAQFETGCHYDAEDVRGWLTEEKPSVALAIFPLERYTGTFTSDLFADEDTTYFDDAEQFLALQQDAVRELAEQHCPSAAWVDVVESHHVSWWQYGAAEDGEAGGVVIQFTPSGRVEVREGLVRREVRESVREVVKEDSAPKPKLEYSGPLVRYIAAQKSIAVMAALLANPRKAKEVAVVQMMSAGDRSGRVRLETHPALGLLAEADYQPGAWHEVEQECRTFSGLVNGGAAADEFAAPSRGVGEALILSLRDAASLYEAVKTLTDDDLDRLHVLLTVLTFGQGSMDGLDTDEGSLFNRVAIDLGVDMRAYWRPDEAFLMRRTKDQLEQIARESGLPLSGFKTSKKSVLAQALARHFERCLEAGADANEAERNGRDWLPGAMLFPAVSATDINPAMTEQES